MKGTDDLLRRALKNHDAIAAALRTGMSSNRLFKAIDDMRNVKAEATELGLYGKSVTQDRNGVRVTTSDQRDVTE